MPTNLTRGYLGGVNSGIGCSTLLPLWLAFIVVVWPSIPTIELPPRGCWFWGAFYVSFWEALGIVSGRQTLLPTLSLSLHLSLSPSRLSFSPSRLCWLKFAAILTQFLGSAGWLGVYVGKTAIELIMPLQSNQPASQPASKQTQPTSSFIPSYFTTLPTPTPSF